MKKDSIFSRWWFWLILILVVVVTITIPFIINESYMANKGYVTLWEAKDVLSFYGDYLAFIGTVALGGLALWQNFRLYATTAKQEKKKIAVENYALFSFEEMKYVYLDENLNEGISNQHIPVKGFNGDCMIWQTFSSQPAHELKLEFKIRNIGKSLATNIYISDTDAKKMENTNVLHTEDDNNENDKKYILPNDEGVLIILVAMATLNSERKITYPLRYQNPFGSIFTQKIEVKKLHDNMVLIETQMIIEIQKD